MSEISAAQVKALREKSGAGMMDCKKALAETNGDFEAAVDWLRKKGLAAAAKKAGRVAAEGLVAVATHGPSGAMIEVNSETDFVARNEHFQALVRKIAKTALKKEGTVDELLKDKCGCCCGEGTIEEEITRLIAVIGENLSLRRMVHLNVKQGVVASYVHNAVAPELGKIGVLVAIESFANPDQLLDLGKKIAMHIAATQPKALAIADLDPKVLEREKSILIEQARATGRPEPIVQKMLEGRVQKYYAEVVLLEQTYVIDGQSKVADVIAALAKQLGHSITVTGFARFGLGEGIEKKETDFAAEVQAQLNG